MIDAIANALDPLRNAGFGFLDLCLLVIALASVAWVHFSHDTHGYITVGYRVPFHKLPTRAKAKVCFSLACGVALLARVVSVVG